MNQTYRRILIVSILYLITSIMFGISAVLQVSLHNPIAAFTGIASLLFLINFIWAVSTPFVVIENDALSVNNALFNRKHLSLKDIARIEVKGLKRLDIYTTDGARVRVQLATMASSQREEFVNLIKGICPVTEPPGIIQD